VGTSKITGGQGLHNKPISCGASGAYAPGSDDEVEEEDLVFSFYSGIVVLIFCTLVLSL